MLIRFRNHYECPRCDEAWTDEWDSTCDDRCPGCNLSCSPVSSDDIDEEERAANIEADHLQYLSTVSA